MSRPLTTVAPRKGEPDEANDEAIIHLRLPRALKAAWVAQSRAEGVKLTDWIVQRVERPDSASGTVTCSIRA